MRVLVACCCLLATLDVVLSVNEASFTIKTKTPRHFVSDKFISFVMDPGHLTGNEFINNIDKAVTLARGLAPAYVRLGGRDGNKYRYLIDETDEKNNTITAEQWDRFNEFTKLSNVEAIIVVDALKRRDGHWDPTDAVRLMTYSAIRNYRLNWQLGYDVDELNMHVGDAQLGQDVVSLKNIVDTFAGMQGESVFGPDINVLPEATVTDLLAEYFDHAGDTLAAVTLNVNSKEGLKNFTAAVRSEREAISKNYGSTIANKPLWIAETDDNDSHNFMSTLTWAQKLGTAAQLGVDVILRQPLLVNQPPTPEYWVSYLHKSLVGRTVLDNKMIGNSTAMHLYSHCSGHVHGGMTMFGVNAEQEAVEVTIKTGAWANRRDNNEILQYILTADVEKHSRDAKSVLLNGEPLEMDSSGNLPTLLPKVHYFGKSLTLTLPTNSIVFWVIPGAHVRACLQKPWEESESKVRGKVEEHLEGTLTESHGFSEGEGMNKIDGDEGFKSGADIEPGRVVKNITFPQATKIITDDDWDEIKDKYLISKFMFVLKRDPTRLSGGVATPVSEQDVITVSNDETFGQRFSRALAEGFYTLPSLDHTLYQPATFKNHVQSLQDPLDTLSSMNEDRWHEEQVKKLAALRESVEAATSVSETLLSDKENGTLPIDEKEAQLSDEKAQLSDEKVSQLIEEKAQLSEEVSQLSEKEAQLNEEETLLSDEKEAQLSAEETLLSDEKEEAAQQTDKEYVYVDEGDAKEFEVDEVSPKKKPGEKEEMKYSVSGPSEVHEGLAMEAKKVRDTAVDYGELWEADRGLKGPPNKDQEGKKQNQVKAKGVTNEESEAIHENVMEEDVVEVGNIYPQSLDELKRRRRHNVHATEARHDGKVGSAVNSDLHDSVAKFVDDVMKISDVQLAQDEARNRHAREPHKSRTEVQEDSTRVRESILEDAVTFIKDVIKERQETSLKLSGNLRLGHSDDSVAIVAHVGENKDGKKSIGDGKNKDMLGSKGESEPEPRKEVVHSVKPTVKEVEKSVQITKSTDVPDENTLIKDKFVKFIDPKSFISDLGKDIQTMKENPLFKVKDTAELKTPDQLFTLGYIARDKEGIHKIDDEHSSVDRNVRQSSRIQLPDIKSLLADLPQHNLPMTINARAEETIKLDPSRPIGLMLEEATRNSRHYVESHAKNLESAVVDFRDRAQSSRKGEDTNDRRMQEAQSVLKELDQLEKSVFKFGEIEKKAQGSQDLEKPLRPVLHELEHLRQSLSKIGQHEIKPLSLRREHDENTSQRFRARNEHQDKSRDESIQKGFTWPPIKRVVLPETPQITIKQVELQIPEHVNVLNRNIELNDDKKIGNLIPQLSIKTKDIFSKANINVDLPKGRSMTSDVQDLTQKLIDNKQVHSAVSKTKDFFSNIGHDLNKEVSEASSRISTLPRVVSETIKDSPHLQTAVATSEDLMSKIGDSLKGLTARSSVSLRADDEPNVQIHPIVNEGKFKENFDVVLSKLDEINKDVRKSLYRPLRRRRAVMNLKDKKSHPFSSHKLSEEMYNSNLLEAKKRVQRKSLLAEHNAVKRHAIDSESKKPMYTERVVKVIEYFPRGSKGNEKSKQIHKYDDVTFNESNDYNDSDWIDDLSDDSAASKTVAKVMPDSSEYLAGNQFVLFGYNKDKTNNDWANWKQIEHSLDFGESSATTEHKGRYKRYIETGSNKLTPEEAMKKKLTLVDSNDVKMNPTVEVLERFPVRIKPKLDDTNRKINKKSDINLMVHISAAKDGDNIQRVPHWKPVDDVVNQGGSRYQGEDAKQRKMMKKYQKELEDWSHKNDNEVVHRVMLATPPKAPLEKVEVVKIDSRDQQRPGGVGLLRRFLNKINSFLRSITRSNT